MSNSLNYLCTVKLNWVCSKHRSNTECRYACSGYVVDIVVTLNVAMHVVGMS